MTIQQANDIIYRFMNPGKRGISPNAERHYHDNMNCMVQVLRKIKSLYHPIRGAQKYSYHLLQNSFEIYIYSGNNREVITTRKEENSMDSIFYGILDFIKYYTELKQQKWIEYYKEFYTIPA